MTPLPDPVPLALPPRLCGVYLLTLRGRVVYVGQSVDVAARVSTHLHEREKGFDGVRFVPCDEDDLTRVENILIERYSPSLNRDPARKSFPVSASTVRAVAVSVVHGAGPEGIAPRRLLSRVSADLKWNISPAMLSRQLEADPRVRWVPDDLVWVPVS